METVVAMNTVPTWNMLQGVYYECNSALRRIRAKNVVISLFMCSSCWIHMFSLALGSHLVDSRLVMGITRAWLLQTGSKCSWDIWKALSLIIDHSNAEKMTVRHSSKINAHHTPRSLPSFFTWRCREPALCKCANQNVLSQWRHSHVYRAQRLQVAGGMRFQVKHYSVYKMARE